MKKILIVHDDKLDSEYVWWARHEGEILKREFQVIYSSPQTISNISDIDIVFWVTDPSEYQYIEGPKNIGWALDGKSEYIMGALLDEVVDTKQLVPFIDYSLFKSPTPPAIRPIEGEYIIYTVNENFDNSSTLQLIREFHLTFDPCEPVSLLIKTNRSIDHDINHLKRALNLYPSLDHYKKEVVINGPIQYSELWSMANYFDCFIETDKSSKRFSAMARHQLCDIKNMMGAYKSNNMSSFKTDWSNYINHINFFKERC